MKISIAQLNIAWEDKESNISICQQYIEEATIEGADLIVFPEMTLTGFSMDIAKINDYDGKEHDFFEEMARKFKIAIGYGYVTLSSRRDNSIKGLNRYKLISHLGTELGDYTKIHPFSYGGEDMYYDKGDKLIYTNLKDAVVCPLICYDLRFAELFTKASKYANIILVAANWPSLRREHWTTLLRARAIECQAYVIGVNRIGSGNGLVYHGDSQVISPLGEILLDMKSYEGIATVEIDLKIVEETRKRFRFKDDRREELYSRLF